MPQWQDQLKRRLSMKKSGNFRLVRPSRSPAGSLCVGRLTAQADVAAGKFTLPFEVRWRQAVLTGVRLHVGHDSASCVRGARSSVEEGAGGFTLRAAMRLRQPVTAALGRAGPDADAT